MVWSTDVTYIDGARLCVFSCGDRLVSRRVLSWRVSDSMTAELCVEALEKTISRYGAPEFQHGPGPQFTAASFIDVLQRTKLASASMDAVRRTTTCLERM